MHMQSPMHRDKTILSAFYSFFNIIFWPFQLYLKGPEGGKSEREGKDDRQQRAVNRT